MDEKDLDLLSVEELEKDENDNEEDIEENSLKDQSENVNEE